MWPHLTTDVWYIWPDIIWYNIAVTYMTWLMISPTFIGVDDYKKAEGINGDLKRVQDGLKRAQKLLKQSQKRDYYKILGVKRWEHILQCHTIHEASAMHLLSIIFSWYTYNEQLVNKHLYKNRDEGIPFLGWSTLFFTKYHINTIIWSLPKCYKSE